MKRRGRLWVAILLSGAWLGGFPAEAEPSRRGDPSASAGGGLSRATTIGGRFDGMVRGLQREIHSVRWALLLLTRNMEALKTDVEEIDRELRRLGESQLQLQSDVDDVVDGLCGGDPADCLPQVICPCFDEGSLRARLDPAYCVHVYEFRDKVADFPAVLGITTLGLGFNSNPGSATRLSLVSRGSSTNACIDHQPFPATTVPLTARSARRCAQIVEAALGPCLSLENDSTVGF